MHIHLHLLHYRCFREVQLPRPRLQEGNVRELYHTWTDRCSVAGVRPHAGNRIGARSGVNAGPCVRAGARVCAPESLAARVTRKRRAGGRRDVGGHDRGLHIRGDNCCLRNRDPECAWRKYLQRPRAREATEQVQLRERYAPPIGLSVEDCQPS
jgi:hypothetical protein